jgi:hypothetical protein
MRLLRFFALLSLGRADDRLLSSAKSAHHFGRPKKDTFRAFIQQCQTGIRTSETVMGNNGGFRTIGPISCLLAAGLSAVSAETQHSLRGQIVDALSGSPITDVELTLNTARWESAAEPVLPNSEGRFIFRGLAPGQYILSAARPDFGSIFFGELPDPGTIQTIEVSSSEEEKVIVFRLPPRSTIRGVVTDEFGDPMVRASAIVFRAAWTNGQIVLDQIGRAGTDDRGQFRISNVPPGPYIVCAEASDSGNVVAPSSTQIDFAAHRETRYYTRSCYPGAAGSGRSIAHIAAGQSVVVNLVLGSSSAVRVSGHLTNTLPNLSANLRLVRDDDVIRDENQFFSGTADGSKGTFEFRGVFPGRYHLEGYLNTQSAEGQKLSLTGRLPLVVGSADVDDIELTLEKTIQIDGDISSPEGEDLSPGAVNLGLRSTTTASPEIWTEPIEKNSLRFTSVPPGEYWLLTGNDEGICARSVRLGDQELLHGMVSVTSGMTARLEVTASKHCGTIKGRVLAGEKPIANAKVLLLLSGSAKRPGDLVTDFTDEQGRFSFPALPFGRYRLWAWSMDELGSFVGPANLADYEESGKSVTVNHDDPVTIDLTPLKSEDGSK